MKPEFHDVVVCEGVREELHGKLTILGFLGVSPEVDIRLAQLDAPTGLCFVVLGGRGDGSFIAKFEIVDVSDGRVLTTSVLGKLLATPHQRTMAVLSTPVVLGRAGTYAMRFYLDGELSLEGTFSVAAS